MACGCTEVCNCVVTGVNGVTVTGAGTVVSPYAVSPPPETPFAATNTDGGLTITGAGAYGHTPTIDLNIDPASTAPISVSGSGLRVDCCPAGAVPVDTISSNTTVDNTYQVILVDSETLAAPVTITLPAVHTAGQRYEIKDYGASGAGYTTTMLVAIDPNGNNIDGSGSVIGLAVDGESKTLVSNGTDWATI